MPLALNNPLNWLLILFGLAITFLVLRGVWRRLRTGISRSDRALIRAAQRQLDRGHVEAALELFLRAEAHERAAECAELLHMLVLAAEHRELAGQVDAALDLYMRAEHALGIARIYAKRGEYEEAAATLQTDAQAPPRELAQLWENAFLDTIPSAGETITGAQIEASRRCAIHAAEALQRAGELARAVHFYEVGARPAPELRASVPALEMVPLDLARDRILSRFDAALETAVHLSGSVELSHYVTEPQRLVQSDSLPTPAEPVSDLLPLPEPSATNVPPAGITREPSIAHAPATTPSAAPTPRRDSAVDPRVTISQTDDWSDPDDLVMVPDPAAGQPTQVRRRASRYRLIELLATGRMSAVFRAHDNVLGRAIALKFLPASVAADHALMEVFEREAQRIAGLRHPNIISVHDLGVMDGRPFVAMDLIDGDTLDALLARFRDARLPVLDVLDVADGVLAALEYAHQRGVLHLDVNPGNIMRTQEGRVLLLDFGFAELISPRVTSRPSDGTAYLAPELMRGRPVDQRADVFAAGVALYRMLTGALPFESWSYDRPPRSTRAFSEAIPEALDEVILACINPDPAQRPSSAKPLREAVQRMMAHIEAYVAREKGMTRTAAHRVVGEPNARKNLPDDVQRLLRNYLRS